MIFTCKTKNLKEAVFQMEKIVSKQTTLPILGNLLIEAKKNQLILSATNLEIAIQIILGAKIEKEGEITVPPKILGGFLSNIKDDIVSGELIKNELNLTSENDKINIKGIDANDFPIIPQRDDEKNFFELDGETFSKAISGVLVSVAHNDTRQELNGIFMKLEEEQIVLASTDSFRLTEVKIPLNKEMVTDEYHLFRERIDSLILPVQSLAEFHRTGAAKVSFSVNQKQAFINTDGILVISRIINGNYPEYTQVLPKKNEISVKINREKLLNAVKIASLVANNQNGEIKLKSLGEEKKIVVTAQSIDTGDNVSRVSAEIEGPDFEIFFNFRYLLDALNSDLFEGEELIIKLNQQKSPVIFSIPGKEAFFSYVIMPIIKD